MKTIKTVWSIQRRARWPVRHWADHSQVIRRIRTQQDAIAVRNQLRQEYNGTARFRVIKVTTTVIGSDGRKKAKARK